MYKQRESNTPKPGLLMPQKPQISHDINNTPFGALSIRARAAYNTSNASYLALITRSWACCLCGAQCCASQHAHLACRACTMRQLFVVRLGRLYRHCVIYSIIVELYAEWSCTHIIHIGTSTIETTVRLIVVFTARSARMGVRSELICVTCRVFSGTEHATMRIMWNHYYALLSMGFWISIRWISDLNFTMFNSKIPHHLTVIVPLCVVVDVVIHIISQNWVIS